MERINIVDKLKKCPKGFKLYSPLFGEVILIKANYNGIEVMTRLGCVKNFNNYGQYIAGYDEAECMLFLSKDNRDWLKFNYLEEGHRVMVSDNRSIWALYQYYKENETIPIGISRPPESGHIFTWKYIVPIEQFDFSAKDITTNCQKSIV